MDIMIIIKDHSSDINDKSEVGLASYWEVRE